MSKAQRTGFSRVFKTINEFLDRYILPWPVRFLTFRLVILLTICLLIPLILFAQNTVFVLMTNSYLNVMSVAVSSIVLLYSTISEAHQKQIARLQEKRAREDHTHLTEMYSLILKSVDNQRVEIEDLKRLLSVVANQPYAEKEGEPVTDLQALHSRGSERFHENELEKRWSSELHHNLLVNQINHDLDPDED